MSRQILPIATEHLTAIIQIEKMAHTHPWSESLLRDTHGRGACHRVLIEGGQVVGYFYAQNIVGEVTLLNVAVDPQAQGKGFGRILVEAFLRFCKEQNADSAWLEARESNHRALSLYESCGFNQIDLRLNYYPAQNGKENAVIMTCSDFSDL